MSETAAPPNAPPGPVLARGWVRLGALGFFAGVDVLAIGVLPLPERLTAVIRSAVAPGLGLVPDSIGVAAVLLAAAFLCTTAWFRWGVSIPGLTVWIAGIALTLWLFPGDTHLPDHSVPAVSTIVEPPGGPLLAAHEFTWIMAVYLVTFWFGLLFQRIPLVDRLLARRQRGRPTDARAILHLSAVERARAVALWGVVGIAGGAVPDRALLRASLETPGFRRRARAIRLLAHGRWGGDPFERDNAGYRAAFILLDPTPASEVARAATDDAARSALGMVAVEPGWTRLLDGTLLAAALCVAGDASTGERWTYTLDRWFRLRRGHRPEALQSVIGVARGRAPAWEHATALAIAAAFGWREAADEWQALRRQVLGAVGRGGRTIADNRLVAAGRCWVALTGDSEARSLLRRVTSAPSDPIAQALDALAAALEARPGALRSLAPPHAARSAPVPLA